MIAIGRIGALRMAVAATLAASMMAGPAWGWGRLGHRLAGRIAEARLTPSALAAVRGLLEPGESLADVSTWADEYRNDQPETGAWHYVNVPIAEPRYDPRFDPGREHVVAKLEEYREALADSTRPREERAKALKFLVHLVQDLHQPLHVGHRDDRGGNQLQVQFFGQGSNLHRVWDSGLLERPGRDEVPYAASLAKAITPELADSWSKGSASRWADESLDLARKAYRDPSRGKDLRNGARLDRPYQDANLPDAERRVTQAGVRLASILNELFP